MTDTDQHTWQVATVWMFDSRDEAEAWMASIEADPSVQLLGGQEQQPVAVGPGEDRLREVLAVVTTEGPIRSECTCPICGAAEGDVIEDGCPATDEGLEEDDRDCLAERMAEEHRP